LHLQARKRSRVPETAGKTYQEYGGRGINGRGGSWKEEVKPEGQSSTRREKVGEEE